MSYKSTKKEVDMLKRRIRYLRERMTQENNLAGALHGELYATTMAMVYLHACVGIDLDALHAMLDAAKKYAQTKDPLDLTSLGAVVEQAMKLFVPQLCPECGANTRRAHKKRCSKNTISPSVIDYEAPQDEP